MKVRGLYSIRNTSTIIILAKVLGASMVSYADSAVESGIQGHVLFSELQVFALDWAKSNLYMIFHGQRRIFACSSGRKQNKTSSEMSCAEHFGNLVADSVGGLALDPNKG